MVLQTSKPRQRRIVLLCSAGLLTLALLTRLYLIQNAHYPGQGDYAFYYTVAKNLNAGRWFEIDYIWQYLDRPAAITHSSLSFWAPFTSVMIALSFRLLGEAAATALLPGILFALLLPLPTFFLARAYSPSITVAFGAAALVLFLPSIFRYSLLTDSTIYYTLLATTSLLLMVKGLQGRPTYFLGAAVFAALAHETRLDGVLLAVTLAAVIVVSDQSAVDKIKEALAAAVLYLLVLSPWLLSSYAAQGTLLPSAPSKAAFLTQHDDLFAYSQPVTLARYLNWGVANIVRSKIQALLRNGFSLYHNLGGVVALFSLLGAGLLLRHPQRQRARVAALPPLFFGGGLLFFHTLIATFTGAGGFLRSSHALLPFLLVVALDAIWRLVVSQKVFLIIVVVLGGSFIGEALISSQALIENENQAGRELAALADVLDRQLGDQQRDLILMAAFPWEVHLSTGRRVVPIPTDGIDSLLAAAEAYDVDYLLLPAPRPFLNDIYLGTEMRPDLRLVTGVPGTAMKLFAVVHSGR